LKPNAVSDVPGKFILENTLSPSGKYQRMSFGGGGKRERKKGKNLKEKRRKRKEKGINDVKSLK
jgi:hypothetical protein